jgi:glutathione S-transferase
MAIELYWTSGSPFSWRVLLALECKGLAYRSHLVEMSRGDHRTPTFLAVNPRGEVPVLRDGEVVVSQSIAILAYLDRQYPEPPLFGRTAAETARIWQAVMEVALHLDGPTDDFILPLYFGQLGDKEGQVRAALSVVVVELARLERALADREYLATDALSAADLTAYPLLRSLLRAVEKPGAERLEHRLTPFSAAYPRLAAWMARVEALPGYDRTFPPHWRPA